MNRPPRGYSRLQHRVTRALLDTTDGRELPLSVNDVEVLAQAAVRAAKAEMAPDRARRDCPWGVSGQQVRILVGVANGRTTAQIARSLAIHEDTVKTHLGRLYRAIGATGRAHAVGIGLAMGLISAADINVPAAPAEAVNAA